VSDALSNAFYTAKGNHPGVYYQGNDSWDIGFSFTIRAPELAWNANGVSLEAQLPVVAITQDKFLNVGQPNERIASIPAAGNTNVSILYGVPDATAYDWTGGPAPYSVAPASSISLEPGATWNEHLNALNEPTPVSATNNSAVSLDSLRTFIAGALVGVAGGALVGAIQEATNRPETRISTASISLPGSAHTPASPDGAEFLADAREEDRQ
jgi:hypothetical protein